MPNKSDEIFTVNELMEFLYIVKNTAYDLLNSGQIKAFRVGKLWRIPLASIEEYIDRP